MDKKQPKLKPITAWAMTATDQDGTSILNYVLYMSKKEAARECLGHNGIVRVRLTPIGPLHRAKESSK